MTPIDVIRENHGSIWLFRLQTDAAREWVAECVDPDAQYFGNALAVEHRYVDNLTVGMIEDGLVVE